MSGERLTSNKTVSEMGIYELAHNSCYAKDGKARVRNFENDSDARELAIKLLDKYADIPNEFISNEDFDDFMMDSLQYGTDSILGLVAIFYQHLWAMADLRECLKVYEDLEEQGQLLKFPYTAENKSWNQRTSGWIPCRPGAPLPKDNENVLTSVESFGGPNDIFIASYNHEKDFWSIKAPVRAWRPLPEPYTTESQAEDSS